MDDATAHKRIERFERSMQRLLGEYDELKAENDDLKAEFDHKMRETIRTGVAIGRAFAEGAWTRREPFQTGL